MFICEKNTLCLEKNDSDNINGGTTTLNYFLWALLYYHKQISVLYGKGH